MCWSLDHRVRFNADFSKLRSVIPVWNFQSANTSCVFFPVWWLIITKRLERQNLSKYWFWVFSFKELNHGSINFKQTEVFDLYNLLGAKKSIQSLWLQNLVITWKFSLVFNFKKIRSRLNWCGTRASGQRRRHPTNCSSISSRHRRRSFLFAFVDCFWLPMIWPGLVGRAIESFRISIVRSCDL